MKTILLCYLFWCCSFAVSYLLFVFLINLKGKRVDLENQGGVGWITLCTVSWNEMFREKRLELKQRERWAQIKLTPLYASSDDLTMNEPDLSRLSLFGDLMYMNANYYPDCTLPINLSENMGKIRNSLDHSKQVRVYSTYVEFDPKKHKNCTMNVQLVIVPPGSQEPVGIAKASKKDLKPNIDEGFVEIRAFVMVPTQTVYFVFNDDFGWVYKRQIQNPRHYTTEWQRAFAVGLINGKSCGVDTKDIICKAAQRLILRMDQQFNYFQINKSELDSSTRVKQNVNASKKVNVKIKNEKIKDETKMDEHAPLKKDQLLSIKHQTKNKKQKEKSRKQSTHKQSKSKKIVSMGRSKQKHNSKRKKKKYVSQRDGSESGSNSGGTNGGGGNIDSENEGNILNKLHSSSHKSQNDDVSTKNENITNDENETPNRSRGAKSSMSRRFLANYHCSAMKADVPDSENEIMEIVD